MRSVTLPKQRGVWLVAGITAVSILGALNIFGSNISIKSHPPATDPKHGGKVDGASPCIKNTQDTCVTHPAVDLYPAGREDAENPHLRRHSTDVWKSIGGKVTKISHNDVIILTTSGREFTVQFPMRIDTWWNSRIGSNHSHYKFGVGDTITIDYLENAGEWDTTITKEQILKSSIAIDPASTHGPIRRYPE